MFLEAHPADLLASNSVTATVKSSSVRSASSPVCRRDGRPAA